MRTAELIILLQTCGEVRVRWERSGLIEKLRWSPTHQCIIARQPKTSVCHRVNATHDTIRCVLTAEQSPRFVARMQRAMQVAQHG